MPKSLQAVINNESRIDLIIEVQKTIKLTKKRYGL